MKYVHPLSEACLLKNIFRLFTLHMKKERQLVRWDLVFLFFQDSSLIIIFIIIILSTEEVKSRKF